MDFLSSLFIQKPLNILVVGALFLAGYLVFRYTALRSERRPRMLLVAAGAWIVYAAWEWLVLLRTPEANIRVDLMMIWPSLAILSALAIYRLLRQRNL
jgi:hypothetical protein